MSGASPETQDKEFAWWYDVCSVAVSSGVCDHLSHISRFYVHSSLLVLCFCASAAARAFCTPSCNIAPKSDSCTWESKHTHTNLPHHSHAKNTFHTAFHALRSGAPQQLALVASVCVLPARGKSKRAFSTCDRTLQPQEHASTHPVQHDLLVFSSNTCTSRGEVLQKHIFFP